MRYVVTLTVIAVSLCVSSSARADEITLISPGGNRCPIERMAPDFERQAGHTIKTTFGSGGATRERILGAELFDVKIVQPPYQPVIDSGRVIGASATPLATVATVVGVRKGAPKPDISTADAVKRMLLAAKGISYPAWDDGKGSYTGFVVDEMLKKLGIYEQMMPKVKRGGGSAQLLTSGDIDVALAFGSEMRPSEQVDVVGPLPKEVAIRAAFQGFVGTGTKVPDAANALLKYLSSPAAATVYSACAMEPSR